MFKTKTLILGILIKKNLKTRNWCTNANGFDNEKRKIIIVIS